MNNKKTLGILSLLVLVATFTFAQVPGYVAPNHDSAANQAKQVKKAIVSFGFFSPLNRHISFGFDQLVGSNMVFTGQLGIIGPGVTNSYSDNNPRGAFIEGGMKLFFSPDYIIVGMHRYNAMQGGYFKPQVVVSVFSENRYSYLYNPNTNNSYNTTTAQTYTGVALMLNFGKQWIIGNIFALDMYVGVGYNLTSNNNNTVNSEPEGDDYFSYLITGSDFPLAFSAGLNLGIEIP